VGLFGGGSESAVRYQFGKRMGGSQTRLLGSDGIRAKLSPQIYEHLIWSSKKMMRTLNKGGILVSELAFRDLNDQRLGRGH